MVAARVTTLLQMIWQILLLITQSLGNPGINKLTLYINFAIHCKCHNASAIHNEISVFN